MKLGKWVVGLVVLAGAYGLFWDKYLRVSIKPATEAQIRAVIPAGLLPSGKPDPVAESRFQTLAAFCAQMKAPTQVGAAFDKENLAGLPANGELTASAMAFLRKGPIQAPSPSGVFGFESWSHLKQFAKLLAFQARTEGKAGDSAECEQAIQNGLDLATADRSAGGGLIGYLVYAAIDAIAVENAADCIRSGWLKATDLRKLIAAIKEYGLDDEELKKAYRQDLAKASFDKITGMAAIGKELQDPKSQGSDAAVGNFDALQTTGILSKVYGEWIANAGQPWSAQDDSEEKRTMQFAKSLPEDPSQASLDPDHPESTDEKSPSAFDKLKYRLKMNAIPNSWAGTILGGLEDLGRNAREVSIKTSCMQELLRGLDAIWAYKEEHGGKYPGSLDELVTAGYLKQVPTDWFSQKPLLYNARTHVIYSVGKNMKDDGGKLTRDMLDLDPDLGFRDQPRSFGH